MKLRIAGLIATTAALVTCTLSAPALAGSSGPMPPAGWPADLAQEYQAIFGGAGAWAPQGTIVADSGFRPYPNGFPFQNWGADLTQNALFFGVPQRVTYPIPADAPSISEAPLNALAMRRSFGDGVCLDAASIDPRTGSCTLTSTAQVFAAAIQAQADGGHCFGLAAAAAALFNGQLTPNQVGSSLVLSANSLSTPTQQTITRLFVSQFFGGLAAVDENSTAASVVQTLIRGLSAGVEPYILVLSGPVGGHGITPYAVYDRGNGLYDIAVYDNNWPNQPRAVHVDTVANTFEYQGQTNPSQQSMLWSSQDDGYIGLASVADTLGSLTCPICRGRDHGTFIAFSAVAEENAGIELDVQALDGSPLPPGSFQVLNPLNPPDPEQKGLPMIIVSPGVSFRVVLDAAAIKTRQPVEIYAMEPTTSRYVDLDDVLPGTTHVFAFDVKSKDSLVAASNASSPRLLQTVERPGVSTTLNGHLLAMGRGTTATQDWDQIVKHMTYRSSAKRDTRWNVQATRATEAATDDFVALSVDVPAGASIVVDYGHWAKATGPRAWVDLEDDGRPDRRITFQPVTPELLKAHASELFVQQGPG